MRTVKEWIKLGKRIQFLLQQLRYCFILSFLLLLSFRNDLQAQIVPEIMFFPPYIQLQEVPPLNTLHFKLVGLEMGVTYAIRLIHGVPICSDGLQIKVDGALQSLDVALTATSSKMEIELINSCSYGSLWLSLYQPNFEQTSYSSKSPGIFVSRDSISAEDLIKQYLIGANCFDVNNVTFKAYSPRFRNYFTNGQTGFSIDEGIIIANGWAWESATQGTATIDHSMPSAGELETDIDLISLDSPAFSASFLEFDFTPTVSNLSFDYVFTSMEYCSFIDAPFNDVFGLFISGPGINGSKNLALIPNTNIPVSVKSVNHLNHAEFYISNKDSLAFIPVGSPCNSAGPGTLERLSATSFQGMTVVLTAATEVVPCSTYHLKFVVSDVGDRFVNSAVLLAKSSFGNGTYGGTALAEVNYTHSTNKHQEGCANPVIVLRRSSGNNIQDLTVPLFISGTAIMGLDFAPIDSVWIIPSGQDSIAIPIQVFDDGVSENEETIILEIGNPCSCAGKSFEVHIVDPSPTTVEGSGYKICYGESLKLSPEVQTGYPPFGFLWEDGSTNSTFDVSSSGNYLVTVTDDCNQTAIANLQVAVTEPFWVEIVKQDIGLTNDTFLLTLQTNLPETNLNSIIWSPSLHLEDSTAKSTLAWPSFDTDYKAVLTSLENCIENTSLLVTAANQIEVYVPNVFSPNNDGNNDRLWIFGRDLDILKVNSFEVFDRWGNKVFEQFDGKLNQDYYGWEGQFRAETQLSGVFVWQASVVAYNGKVFNFTGEVTLLR